MDRAAHRRELLRRGLTAEGIDLYLVSNPINVTYLTGFSGESSYLLVNRERDLLVSDARFTEQLAEECPGLEVYIRPPTKRPLEALAEQIRKLGVHGIGFESVSVTVAELEALQEALPSCHWKGGGSRVEQLRIIKDESEITAIREAIAIAERAFTAFTALLRPDDTEKDLVDAMEHFVRRCGGKCTCFPSIIAAGPRAALPHAPPTTRRLHDDVVLLVDWGVTSERLYKSDLTRVLDTRRREHFTHRRADCDRLETVHGVVRRAQQKAIEAVRPGVAAHVIDEAARSVIAEAGFGDYFGHGLGHGIGLQVHEAPALRPGSETLLRPGMVFTIEPGIYLPGQLGVRIEDDVLVTPDGCEVLTHVDRDLKPLWPGC